MEKKSIADLFNERGNNTHSNLRSNNNVTHSHENKQGSRQVEEHVGQDPISLMSPEDAKQVTASSVDINDAISEIASLWSGKKTVEKSYDLSRYAKANEIDEDEEGEE